VPTHRRRAAAVRRRTTAPPRSPRVSTACVSPARTSRALLDRRARAPRGVCALAAAPLVRPPRTHAEGRITRALTCRSHHCEASRPASTLGYKRLPSSSPSAWDRRPPTRHRCRRRWAHSPARSRRRPNPPSPSLDHPRAPMAAHWASSPRVSPEPEPQRTRRRVLAATACRGHLRSGHRHQSTCGEPNHTPTPHVYLLRPPFAAGEPTRRREGSCVRISILPRALVQRRGSFERLKNSRGPCVKMHLQ
jgi:hypothetical protein